MTTSRSAHTATDPRSRLTASRTRAAKTTRRPRRATPAPGDAQALHEPEPRGLALLLGNKREEFLRRCWPDKPFVYHGPIERLRRLTRLDALRSVPGLLAARASCYQDMIVFSGDEFAKYMPPREAVHFYQRGDIVSCADLQTTIPELRTVLSEMAIDLKEPPQHFSCGMFGSCGTRGASMHYDSVLNFNLQLRGEKVWRLAPNRHVENPMHACYNKDAHAPRYARLPLPEAMPPDAMTFRAKPGTIVYIPRGYWHETEPDGDSLAITFDLNPPTWRGRVLHELARQLEGHAAWRAFPMALTGGREDRGALVRQLEPLLAQLCELVGALQPEALVDAPISARRYRWPGGTPGTLIASTRRGRTEHRLRVTRTDGVREIAIAADLLPVVRWLCARDAVWSIEQARAACPTLGVRYVDALLAELAAQGFLEAA